MRLSNILTIIGAGLAIASPVVNRGLHTKFVTTVVYEYVTVTATVTTQVLGLPSATTGMVGSSLAGHGTRGHHYHPAPSPCDLSSEAIGMSKSGVSILSTSTSVLTLPPKTTLVSSSSRIVTLVAVSSIDTTKMPPPPPNTPTSESPLAHVTSLVSVSPIVTTKVSSSSTTSTSESLPAYITTSTAASPLITTTAEAPLIATSSVTSEPQTAILPSASPVTAVSATFGLSPGTDYSSALVYHHNIHRSNHSSPDVAWDANLASYAATVANSCIYAHDTSPGGGGYGQNIAAASYPGHSEFNNTYLGSSAITDLFYDSEFANFLPSYYGVPGPAPGIDGWDHFSQILWASTTKIGCATTLCAAGKIFTYPTWYTVCDYTPQGNVAGAYGANIGAPRGDDTVRVI